MPLIKKSIEPPKNQTESAEQLVSVLRSGATEDRWLAARQLAERPGMELSLAKALETESEQLIRQAILTGIVTLDSEAGVQAILPYLRVDDAALRVLVLDALKAMPHRLKRHIGPLLADANVDVRILSCDLARELPGAIVTPLLLERLLHDPMVNVCTAAIDTLAEIGTPDVLPHLRQCIHRFPADPFFAFAVTVATNRLSGSR